MHIRRSVTSRASISLAVYLSDINKYTLITVEEESNLAFRIKKFGDQSALKKLVTANLRFVVSVAKQYQYQGMPLSDLINEGNMGLIKAASKFDETRGFKFISYAVLWIRQYIRNALAEQSRIANVPSNQVTSFWKIGRVRDLLTQELEREPIPAELAFKMNISSNKVEETIRAFDWPMWLDLPFFEDEENTILDLLKNDSLPTDNGLIQESLAKDINNSLGVLKKRDQEILKKFFGIGYNHARTIHQIAEEHGMTFERVRQIKESSICRLRETSRTKKLKTYL